MRPGSYLRDAWRRRISRGLGLLLALTLAAALALSGCGGESGTDGAAGETVVVSEDGTVWTCSMHPDVRQPEPGDCPICGMDLIPVEPEKRESGTRRLTVSEAGLKLMEIETATVARRDVGVDVPLVGTVSFDEGRVERISAWVAGRIERMHVDYEGAAVRRGEPMVDIYSPELIAAQEELLGAADAYERSTREGGTPRSALATLEAARERLVQWGLTESQVAAIEEQGSPRETITLVAPVGGTVVEKNAEEGAYVRMGTVIYTIADLSVVWIELEAYESDLTWLEPGQHAEFRTEAHPGRVFRGTVSFIDPVVDPSTRTVDVRLEAPNEDGTLKPGMYVSATARATYGSGRPLTIPATAPLLTGRRAVVYVEVPDEEMPTYEGREVVLGPKAGDYYVVESGLGEGERVVVEGAFKIDSALQIRARPSMMSPERGADAATGDEGGGSMQSQGSHQH